MTQFRKPTRKELETRVTRQNAVIDRDTKRILRAVEVLESQKRTIDSLVTAAEAVLRRWSEMTSQEMYGEHLREGMELEDFESWETAHDTLRAAVRGAS